MKKKELLVIFVLAVLVTGLIPLFQSVRIDYGLPVGFLRSALPVTTALLPLNLLVDLLFWSVVLAAGWWIIKKLNKPLNLKNNLPIKPLVLLLIIASVIGGALVWKRKVPLISTAIPTPTPYKTYPSILNFNFYPIHEIKKQRFGPGSYNTEGYVVKIFTCPPCPTRVLCKPCMGENIVISEESKILTDYSSLTDNELIIFAQNPKQFNLGKKYQFSLKLTGKESSFGLSNESILDVEFLGYDEIIPCDKLEKQIKRLLEQANYCQKDSDCKLVDLPLGCPFGCYNFVNKNENLSVIKEGAEKYQKNCNSCTYKCATAPRTEEISCRNNKCLDIRFVTR